MKHNSKKTSLKEKWQSCVNLKIDEVVITSYADDATLVLS